MKSTIQKLYTGSSLSKAEAAATLCHLLDDNIPDAQIGALLAIMSMRGETPDELSGFLTVMRERSIPVSIPSHQELMDNCGTGGGGPSTFNISTAAALVLAAGGVAMAKHGNRSASSLSGSADVAEALGLSLAKTPDEAAHHMAHSGFCFLFAPLFQPDLARMAPLRKSLGIRTFFNLLGPLMNPANVSRQMIGVSSIQHLDTLAQVLATTQVRQAYVIAGADQMDEFSLCAPTHVRHVLNQDIRSYSVTPEDFGLLHCDPRELMGGDARTNAQIIEDIMSNDDISARRDVVVMNASAGFVLAGLEANFKSGSERAQDVLKSQKAMQLLHTLRNLPQ